MVYSEVIRAVIIMFINKQLIINNCFFFFNRKDRLNYTGTESVCLSRFRV